MTVKHDWQKKENKYSNLPQNSMALGVVVLCNSFTLYQFPHNSPKNFNQIYIIKVFLNDSSECYCKILYILLLIGIYAQHIYLLFQ